MKRSRMVRACVGCAALLMLFANSLYAADTLKVLAIRVEFQVDNEPTTTGDGTFDLTIDNEPFRIDPTPHDRSYFQDHLLFLSNYYFAVSNGELMVEGDVFPIGQNDAYQLPNQMNFYNPNSTEDAINTGLATLVRDAITAADADPAIRFADYDSYMIFHAGVGRDIDVGLDETPQDIPSLFVTPEFLSTYLGIAGIDVDGGATTVNSAIILPETESQEGIELGLNGIIVSNFGSQLGWLDLFSPETGRSGVGRFGVMDAGLFNGDGLLPSLPMAWTRVEAGWETPEVILQAQQDEFTIHQAASPNGTRIYQVPINASEYFLLENRYSGTPSLDSLQIVMIDERNELVSMREVLETHLADKVVFSDSTGVLIDIDNFDRGLPGGGVLIWHIDEQVIAAKRAANRINADPALRGVDLEEADGSQDIGEEFEIIDGGSGSEIGTSLDPWYSANNAPLYGEDPAGTFSLESVPNSRSNYNRANSHIAISSFSDRDSVMTFRVSVNFFQQNYPQNIDPQTAGVIRSLKVADLSSDGDDELIALTDQGQILIFDENGLTNWGDDIGEPVVLPRIENLIYPPAIFGTSGFTEGMVVLSGNTAYGYSFNTAARTLDSLFDATVRSVFSTPPIAREIDNQIEISFGAINGNIFTLDGSAGWDVSSTDAGDQLVAALHFIDDPDPYVLLADGGVYRNGNLLLQTSADLLQPFGETAVGLSPDGLFWQFDDPDRAFSEAGIHRFDSDPIQFPVLDRGDLVYKNAVVGNNQLYVFNENFTLQQNFPVPLYATPEETNMTIAPLVGVFPDENGQPVPGIVYLDPAGVISAVDLNGVTLPDFPLAVGDSISSAPAILDIDGDGDHELACATAGGGLFLWDFTVGGQAVWPQQYATAGNLNRSGSIVPGEPEPAASLLPENAAYNWPNPNQDDFTFIRYRLTEAAEVSIKIFDLAGDLVKTFDGPGEARTDNEVRWDLSDVQSGVYLGRIEANGGGQNEVRIIKIAVVK